MNRQELIDQISQKTNLSKTDCTKFLDGLVGTLEDVFAQGGRLQIANLGTFEARTKAARKARNPRTGETVDVPERKKLQFKAAGRFLEKAA